MKKPAPITKIYFVRHGDVRNPKKIIYGWRPFPLSRLGVRQIRQVADKLSGQGIQVIYSSPIARCNQSAHIIADKLGVDVIKNDLLIESEWGIAWDGVPVSQMSEKFARDWQAYHTNPGRLQIQDVSLADLAKRVNEFAQWAIKKYPGQKIAAVTHGDPLKAYILKLEKKSYNDLHRLNCSYACAVEVTFQGTRFKKLKYISHGSRDLVHFQ